MIISYFIEWGYFPEYEKISFERQGRCNKPEFELLRQKEVHSRGVKAVSVWQAKDICGGSEKFKSSRHRNPFIATGSYDGTVNIWFYNNLEHIKTFSHHPEGVWDVRTHNNLLASCGTDGKVAVMQYELNSGATRSQTKYVNSSITILFDEANEICLLKHFTTC